MAGRKLLLQTTSIYKNTPLYQDKKNFDDDSSPEITFFGTAVLPEVKLTNRDNFITLREVDNGRLDLIASEYYGDPRLHRIIAIVNEIYDPLYGVDPGTVIRLPLAENIALTQSE